MSKLIFRKRMHLSSDLMNVLSRDELRKIARAVDVPRGQDKKHTVRNLMTLWAWRQKVDVVIEIDIPDSD